MFFQRRDFLLTETAESILLPSYFGGMGMENKAGFQGLSKGFYASPFLF
jgi:hypothetical protein